MVHLSDLFKVIENIEFSVAFVKEDGSIVEGKRCVCTSFYSEGTTLNLKFCDSEEIRKIRRSTIISFNGEEAFI